MAASSSGPRPGLGVDDEAPTGAVGLVGLVGPVDLVEGQLVGQAERDHLGIELVIAVGAHAASPAATPSAWRAPGVVSQRRQPAPLGHAELLGPRVGTHARPLERVGVDDAGQGPPQHLAALGESGPHDGVQPFVGDEGRIDGGLRTALQANQHRLDARAAG